MILPALPKSDNFLCKEIRTSLFSHRDRTIPIVISMTKLKGRGGLEKNLRNDFRKEITVKTDLVFADYI